MKEVHISRMASKIKKQLVIKAEPEPIKIDPHKTALIVVDMQNAFVSNGGMFDLYGLDISEAQRIVEACKNVISAARQAGCKIVYLRQVYNPDLSNAGGRTRRTGIKN